MMFRLIVLGAIIGLLVYRGVLTPDDMLAACRWGVDLVRRATS